MLCRIRPCSRQGYPPQRVLPPTLPRILPRILPPPPPFLPLPTAALLSQHLYPQAPRQRHKHTGSTYINLRIHLHMHVGINRAHGWSRARRAAARRTATGRLFRQPLLPPPQRSLIACIRAARSLTAGLVQLAGFLTFLRVLIACISLYEPV